VPKDADDTGNRAETLGAENGEEDVKPRMLFNFF
jgi:hypothetical protein